MDLSTAIREGATKRPQCFGEMFALVNVRGGRAVIGSCAMGAAYEALGQPPTNPDSAWHVLHQTFPVLREEDRCVTMPPRSDPWPSHIARSLTGHAM